MKNSKTPAPRLTALTGAAVVVLSILLSILPAFSNGDFCSLRLMESGWKMGGFSGFSANPFSMGRELPTIMEAGSPVQSFIRGLRHKMHRERPGSCRISSKSSENIRRDFSIGSIASRSFVRRVLYARPARESGEEPPF